MLFMYDVVCKFWSHVTLLGRGVVCLCHWNAQGSKVPDRDHAAAHRWYFNNTVKQERIGAKAGQAPCKASAAASERQFSSRITSYNYKVWGITNPPFCVFEMNIYSQIVVGT